MEQATQIYECEDAGGHIMVAHRIDDGAPSAVVVSCHGEASTARVALPMAEAHRLAEALDPDVYRERGELLTEVARLRGGTFADPIRQENERLRARLAEATARAERAEQAMAAAREKGRREGRVEVASAVSRYSGSRFGFVIDDVGDEWSILEPDERRRGAPAASPEGAPEPESPAATPLPPVVPTVVGPVMVPEPTGQPWMVPAYMGDDALGRRRPARKASDAPSRVTPEYFGEAKRLRLVVRLGDTEYALPPEDARALRDDLSRHLAAPSAPQGGEEEARAVLAAEGFADPDASLASLVADIAADRRAALAACEGYRSASAPQGGPGGRDDEAAAAWAGLTKEEREALLVIPAWCSGPPRVRRQLEAKGLHAHDDADGLDARHTPLGQRVVAWVVRQPLDPNAFEVLVETGLPASPPPPGGPEPAAITCPTCGATLAAGPSGVWAWPKPDPSTPPEGSEPTYGTEDP